MIDKYKTKTGEYVSSQLSENDLTKYREQYSWMQKYLGQLKGAVIKNVGINIDLEKNGMAFPSLTIELFDGGVYECEILSVYDTDSPGFISGLPHDFGDV